MTQIHLDRTVSPSYKTIDKIDIQQIETKQLSNGMPVFCMRAGTQELVKIELIFEAGIWHQQRPLTAVAVNSLISEGTSRYSAAQLADNIDFYGAFLEQETDQDDSSICFYSANKHLANCLPYVEEIIKDAIFPEHELQIYKENKKQRYLINSQKVSTLARREFSRLVLGNTNPYGYFVELEDYEKLNRQEIIDYYKTLYHSGNCYMVVSGMVDDTVLSLLEKHFGGQDWKASKSAETEKTKLIQSTKEQFHLVKKDDAIQSAIRIGRLLFNKTHPDYHPMLVLNCVLGGYFGSRLMANIREDKGYTYGIGSGIASMQKAGYFFISTEVGVDVCSNAIEEIYKEIRLLREELIDESELETVRNYMLGVFLRSTDGAFALADKFKGIYEYGLGYEYYERFIHTLKTIRPHTIRELANQYLQEKDLIELVVGKK
jgi:zinc protease